MPTYVIAYRAPKDYEPGDAGDMAAWGAWLHSMGTSSATSESQSGTPPKSVTAEPPSDFAGIPSSLRTTSRALPRWRRGAPGSHILASASRWDWPKTWMDKSMSCVAGQAGSA